MKKISLLMMAVFVLLTSCTITKHVPGEKVLDGTYYDDLKGATENRILRTLGAPRAQTSDGNGGKILTYEEVAYVTQSDSYSSGYYSSSTTASAKGYSNGVYGSSDTQSRLNSSNHNTTVSNEDRKFKEFFINPQGTCYQVRTSPHFYKYKTISPDRYVKCITKDSWLCVLATPLGALITTIAIVAKRAKGCPYCDEIGN